MSNIKDSECQETNVGTSGHNENTKEEDKSERTSKKEYDLEDTTETKSDKNSLHKAVETQDNEISLWGGAMVFINNDNGLFFENFRGLKIIGDIKNNKD